MAVILVDGFDLYNGIGTNTGLLSKWGNSSLNSGMGTGRFGGQCMTKANSSSPTQNTTRTLPTGYSSIGVGFAFKTATVGVEQIFAFNNTNVTRHVGMQLTATGAITVTGGAGTVLGTSANNVIVGGVWHYIEFGTDIHDSTGTIIVKVDGVSIFNLSGLDTRNGATTTVDTLSVCAEGGLILMSFDDLYVVDSSATLGERRVETLYPTSDVAQGWSRSTGSTNYTLVDEAIVNGDTDYVQATNVGDVDTYGFQDLTGTPATIDAVQVSAFAEKTDATSRSIALQIKSGATTSDGANFALAANYTKYERLILQNPDGSVDWTYAAVNALQGGPKVTV